MSHIDSVPGPDTIIRHVMPNGITVLVRENHSSPAVVMQALVRAGAAFETRPTAGLAAITAAALMRGTPNRSFETIYEEIESIGAFLRFSGGVHSTSAFGKSLAEDLPTLLRIFADVLRRPTFPEDQLEQLRRQIITELRIREHDTHYRAALAFAEMTYPPDHPYHYSTRGYLDTIPELTRARIQAFHQKHYGPRDMIMVIVGAVPAQEVLDQVEAVLGDWANPDQPTMPAMPAVSAPCRVLRRDMFIPDKPQADIVLGVPGPARTAPDWWPAVMANSILGSFGLYGRLGEVVRDKLGLAYYSYSTLEGREGPGPWRVIAGVDPQNVERAIDSIIGEVARITTELVTETELDDNQSNLTGSLPLQLESNEGVAGALLTMEHYRLGLDYLQRYATIVRSITRQEVLAAAQHYLNPQAYVVAVAGPTHVETPDFPG